MWEGVGVGGGFLLRSFLSLTDLLGGVWYEDLRWVGVYLGTVSRRVYLDPATTRPVLSALSWQKEDNKAGLGQNLPVPSLTTTLGHQ